MASGTAPPSDVVSAPAAARPASPNEALIERRLRMTRRRVRTVDLACGLTTFAAAILAYLFVCAQVDHWVVSGGLGFWGRFFLWAVMLAVGGYYLVRNVAPLLLYRISPVFAAYAIEQGWPSFKNSLINFLFLRQQRNEFAKDELARRVYQGLESQAAAGLTRVSAETAVDRSHLVRVGYILAGVVAVCCFYLAISPKSLLASFGRVLWPWASIPAPTWVTIDAVKPGDAAAYQGDTIVVSAEVHRLRANGTVHLVYRSADGQTIGQVPMSVPEHEYRYQAELPPGRLGLQQDLVYWLSAGDCTTRRFHVEVQTPLAIAVDRVEYKYPAYTGLPPRTVLRDGDLRAIEGTEATIHATASHEIASAYIELDGESRQSVRMDTSGPAAAGRVTLKLNPEDPKQPDAIRRPEYTSYQLRFIDAKQRENRRPVRHRIEVDPDGKPKVRFVAPTDGEVPLLANDSLEWKVAAEDDFGLRRVVIVAEVAGKPLEKIPPLVEVAAPQKALQGPVEKGYQFKPAQWNLKGGERVTYWAEAYDNKEEADKPAFQKAETEKRVVVIVAPERQQPPREGGQGSDNPQGAGAKPGTAPDQNSQPGGTETQPPTAPNEGPKPQEAAKTESSPPTTGERPKQPEQEPGASQPGENGPQGASKGGQGESSTPEGTQGAQGPGSQTDKPQEPIPGDTRPGDIMEKVLQYRDQQEKQAENKTPSGQENPKPGVNNAPQPGEPKAQPGAGEPKPQPGAGEPKPAAPPQGDAPPKEPGQDGAGGTGREKPKPQETQENGPGDKQASGMSGAKGGKPGSSKPQEGPAGPGGQGESPSPTPKSPSQEGPSKGKTGSGASAKQQPDSQKGPGGNEAAAGQTQEQGAGERQPVGKEKPGAEQTTPGAKPDGLPDARNLPGEAAKPGVKEGTDSAGAKPAPKEPGGTPGTQEKPATEAKTPGSGGNGADRSGTKEKAPGAAEETPEPKGAMPKPESRSIGEGIPKRPDQPTAAPPGDSSPGAKQSTEPSPKSAGKTPGEKTPSDKGGGQPQQKEPGETGKQAGGESKADQGAGKSGSKDSGGQVGGPPQGDSQGAGDRKEPSGPQPPDQPQGSTEKPGPQGGNSDAQGAAKAADKQPQETGSSSAGNSGRGGAPGDARGPSPASEQSPTRPDDPNLEYARQRTDLALRTLQEELAKEKSPLLERLGWTPADAERFLREWQAMMKAAQEQGPRGKDAKQELDKALRSLGLRPRGTQSPKALGQKDQVRSQDPGRFAPPPEWSDFFKWYTEGVGSSKP
jgi:hypothetical protein